MSAVSAMSLVLLLALSPVAFGVEDTSGGAALGRVVQLLEGMLAKAKSAKDAEEISFAEYKVWCGGEQKSFAHSIKASTAAASKLENGIFKLENDIKGLGASISTLQSDSTRFEAQLKAQVKERKQDYAEFVTASKDFTQSIDAVERATAVLSQQSGSASAGAVLLQVSESSRMPQNAKSMLQSFASLMDSDFAGETDGTAQLSQGGGTIDMLNKLRDDFDAQLNKKQVEEMNSKHASDMITVDLKDSIENAKKSISSQTIQKARKISAVAISKKELREVSTDKTADVTTLRATKESCIEKKQAYTANKQRQAEEMEAITKALEILQNPDTMSGAKLLRFAQTNTDSVALTQFLKGSVDTESQAMRQKLRLFVAQRAEELNSPHLSLLAEKLEAAEQLRGPFDKIKKMISSMVSKLVKEGNADAERNGFCDKEMGRSKITRTDLSEKVSEISAAVEEGRAEIMMLQQASSKLSGEVAALDKSMKEASELRSKEKAKNKATLKEAGQAQTAVEAAMNVLKKFYSKQAFMQVKTGHKARHQAAEAGGVIALLETILADFANIQVDTDASESLAVKAHQELMSDCKMNKATKAKSVEMSDSDKVGLERQMQSDKSDLLSTQEKLLAANQYHVSLKPKCEDKAPSYEERAAERKAEIQSMKEALELLAN